jgi:hypothetical protein
MSTSRTSTRSLTTALVILAAAGCASDSSGSATSDDTGETAGADASTTTSTTPTTSSADGADPTSSGVTASGTADPDGSSSGGIGDSESSTGEDVICPLPDQFSWISSGPLAEPQSPANHDFVSLKDFTVVRWADRYVVYATAFDASSSWTGVYFEFADWPEAAGARQIWLGPTSLGGTVAPHLIYFTPKDTWVLTYQWGFKYATTDDPTDPTGWTSPQNLLIGDPTTGTGGTGPIDQTVICDDADCYLFFAGDNGHIYRGSMPIADFPSAFSNTASIMNDEVGQLFEAVEVYAIKGAEQYLMIVEAWGSTGRIFRAFTANSLDGEFTAMPMASSSETPFAGLDNVTFEGDEWTHDISHGDVVRTDPSEKKIIDVCNLQFLYQGRDPSVNVDYGLLPYRPGLLTLVQ